MSAENKKKENLLVSWKEVALYLNISETTCRRREKEYNLPIHRLPDSKRSNIFAYKDELDEWLKNFTSKERNLELNSSFMNILKEFRVWLIIVIVLIAAFLILFNPFRSRIPSDFRINKSVLKVLNENGKEMWSFDTGFKNLESDDFYHRRANFKTIIHKELINDRWRKETQLPKIMFIDLDNNGKLEILFSIQTHDEFNEERLFCFDSKGNKLWHYTTGKEIQYGDKIFSSDFRIFGFETCDFDSDGLTEIFVISNHKPDFPTQLLVLSSEGNKLGEYWNSGRLTDISFIDLNRDGIKDLIVPGMNNEYMKGCLIVFDINKVSGGSPQLADLYKNEKIGTGSEKHYILIPKPEDAIVYPMEAISFVEFLKNGRIRVEAGDSHLIYEFDREFHLLDVTLSHQFQILYKDAQKDGLILEELDEFAYINSIKKNILYWDGNSWIK